MEFLLIILLFVVVYFLFIKKGTGGRSFYKHRNELHKHISSQGGMLSMYEDFADYFKRQGFNIKEVDKNSLYLHYGTKKGKVGIQIIQTNFNEANISISSETRNGNILNEEIVVQSDDDQKEMINLLIDKFSNGQIPMKFDTPKKRSKINTTNQNMHSSNDDHKNVDEITKEFLDENPELKAIAHLGADGDLENYLSNNPDLVSSLLEKRVNAGEKATKHADQGRKLIEQKKYNEALHIINEGLNVATDIEKSWLYRERGDCHYYLGNHFDCINDLHQAIEASEKYNPNNYYTLIDLYQNLFGVHFEKNELNEARGSIDKAIEAAQKEESLYEHAKSLKRRAMLHEKLGNQNLAEQDLKKAKMLEQHWSENK